VVIVDTVNFHEILKQHENKVGEESRLLAEVCVLEHVKDLSAHSFEELIISKNFSSSKCSNLVGELLAWLSEHISFEARIHVEFDVS